MKKYGLGSLLFDLLLTTLTGGLWLIVRLFQFLGKRR